MSGVSWRLAWCWSEPPRDRTTSTAWAAAGIPLEVAIPAEGRRTRAPRVHRPHIRVAGPKDFAKGLGHRTATGVPRADEHDDRSRHPGQVRCFDDAGADDLVAVAFDSHRRRNIAQAGGTVIQNQGETGDRIEILGGCGDSSSALTPREMTRGAGRSRRISRIKG